MKFNLSRWRQRLIFPIIYTQVVNGKRIENGFVNRTLPHFEPGALSPEAKGFVASSFFTGMSATEFFMHTMAGREGTSILKSPYTKGDMIKRRWLLVFVFQGYTFIVKNGYENILKGMSLHFFAPSDPSPSWPPGLVDTAVKTAETGYMARRLMKALEDLFVHYDSSIRNSEQSVVQFTYGDDGLDPTSMENGDRPVNFSRLMPQVMHSMPCAGDDLLSPGKTIRG